MTDEKILDRVAKLLAIAEHPNTGEHEADVALSQANRLIAKHAIEEAVLRQAQSIGQRRALERKSIVVGGGEFGPYLSTVLQAAAEANRCSCAGFYSNVEVFGASEDIAWIETLFSMIRLQFLLKINPKWDESKTFDENVYNFKVAGYKWKDIDAVSMEHGNETTEGTKTVRDYWTGEDIETGSGYYHKALRAYRRHAKLIGDDNPVSTQNQQAYRLSFAESFRSTMAERFRRMAEEAQEEMDTIPGAAIVMVSQKEEANRMMWDAFEYMDPEVIARRAKEAQEAYKREREERQAKLDAMTSAQRQAFLEKEEAAERRAARANRAYWNKNSFTYDASARTKGAQAAKSVDISRKAGAADGASARGELV
jgi:hypothetical protein